MIDDVTKALSDHIYTHSPALGQWVVTNESLIGPGDRPITADRLHLWLWNVDQHAHTVNRPEVSRIGGYERAPLYLQLDYVAIYTSDDQSIVQQRLDTVLGVFHTHPILGPADLEPPLSTQVGRLTVRLRTLTLDQRTNIWSALDRPMPLALYYEVDVAPVLLTEPDRHDEVEELHIEYEVMAR